MAYNFIDIQIAYFIFKNLYIYVCKEGHCNLLASVSVKNRQNPLKDALYFLGFRILKRKNGMLYPFIIRLYICQDHLSNWKKY